MHNKVKLSLPIIIYIFFSNGLQKNSEKEDVYLMIWASKDACQIIVIFIDQTDFPVAENKWSFYMDILYIYIYQFYINMFR